MSNPLEDTQPNRPNWVNPPDEPDTTGGPGCLIWGVVLLFSVALAVVIVALAALMGWNDGLAVAQPRATATRQADIQIQCDRIALELTSGQLALVQRRLQDLQALTPAPECLLWYAPTATFQAQQAQITPSPTPTHTLIPTELPTITPTPGLLEVPTLASVSTSTVTTSSGFDLDALLAQARQALNDGQRLDAIDLLEAIQAIDATYQKATVDQLLYQALTAEATRLFRSGTNLAEAVLLATRAEEYGDIADLNYERYIAQLYLEAQTVRNINPQRAIRLLSEIVITQGLRNYLDASNQLAEQYAAYGDLLAISLDYCAALAQYNNALALQSAPATLTKRDTAALNCVPTPLPGSVIDPNTLLTPVAIPNNPGGVAPIGVPGS